MKDGIKKLSSREVEILGYVSHGLFHKEIAEKLSLQIGTIRTHMNRVFKKLYATNAPHAVQIAMREGILNIPDVNKISVIAVGEELSQSLITQVGNNDNQP